MLSEEQINIISRRLRDQGIPISKHPITARAEITYLIANKRIAKWMIPNPNSMKVKLDNMIC
jgi:hypothetical protein